MNPYLIDTTLRDGEQAPGVAFTIDEKLSVASLLDELGVDEVEAGTPVISKNEKEAISLISKAGFSFKTSSWCRAKISDLKIAAELGADSVNISLPVSDIQIETLGKSREWVILELKSVLNYAFQNFSFITMGAQDASRADMSFLKEFIFYAQDYGANRVRINDTVGILDPLQTKQLISDVTWSFPKTEFEFHGHNDFGMATANALTALQSGARCVSGTINGLGERAGNTVLEEIIAYLFNHYRISKYNTKGIKNISNYIATISGRNTPIDKPICGSGVYRHESGIHTAAILKNKKSYQILNPDDFGVEETSFTFGKHSGSNTIKNLLDSKGVIVQDKQIELLLLELEKFSLKNKRSANTEELFSLFINLPHFNKAE